ncbi:hypothetical protein KQX54_018458 [Cotesia glomerata]|uniref:Uncharacterized protein n=1 Tax=Cotesia glomerata TaxID=32391 RepID=A0AAV7IP22_COTGL|nr:hypothetical protein KQX54_018458 [Cotesia glomerata]
MLNKKILLLFVALKASCQRVAHDIKMQFNSLTKHAKLDLEFIVIITLADSLKVLRMDHKTKHQKSIESIIERASNSLQAKRNEESIYMEVLKNAAAPTPKFPDSPYYNEFAWKFQCTKERIMKKETEVEEVTNDLYSLEFMNYIMISLSAIENKNTTSISADGSANSYLKKPCYSESASNPTCDRGMGSNRQIDQSNQRNQSPKSHTFVRERFHQKSKRHVTESADSKRSMMITILVLMKSRIVPTADKNLS